MADSAGLFSGGTGKTRQNDKSFEGLSVLQAYYFVFSSKQ